MNEHLAIVLISACAVLFAGGFFLEFLVNVRLRKEHALNTKELMESVQLLHRQTVDILNESGMQSRQIIELRNYVETLERDNAQLSSRTSELMSRVKALQEENNNLQAKIESLQKSISNLKP